jgi:uncharacterized protein (TIGR03000 family)
MWNVWASVQPVCPLGRPVVVRVPPRASTSATVVGGGGGRRQRGVGHPVPGEGLHLGEPDGVAQSVGVAAGRGPAVGPAGERQRPGTKTAQTGTARSFVSPPVTPEHDYTYEVKTRWRGNGKEVTQTRRILVHAGDVINLWFTADQQQSASSR